jgi:hypothetical protein
MVGHAICSSVFRLTAAMPRADRRPSDRRSKERRGEGDEGESQDQSAQGSGREIEERHARWIPQTGLAGNVNADRILPAEWSVASVASAAIVGQTTDPQEGHGPLQSDPGQQIDPDLRAMPRAQEKPTWLKNPGERPAAIGTPCATANSVPRISPARWMTSSTLSIAHALLQKSHRPDQPRD